MAWGRVANALPASGRRQAVESLRVAFPDLERRELERLARRAAVHRTAAVFDGASACRLDARALCRSLNLDGWDHLEAAEREERGLFVLGAGWGAWQIAALAVALYRGPMETLGPWRADPIFGRLAAAAKRSTGQRLFGELAGGGQLEWSLRAGDRIGFLADRRIGHGETTPVTFLGRQRMAETLIADASIEAEAPIVPVFAHPRTEGRWQLRAHPPIQPAGETAEALTARCFEVVEDEIRKRPELWQGWWDETNPENR